MEYVRHVLGTARATLARSRGNDETFRQRPAAPASAPQPDTQVPTWADERDAVFEAISALRQLGETLTERIAELRHAQTREHGMLGAWRALSEWSDEERAQIETAGRSRDDESIEIPSLRTLRQT